MLNTILIDDEKNSLDSLRIEIERHCPELNVLAACKGARAGVEAIRQHHPDLIFLDIDMPVMNGFQLLEEVRDISFDVIFATAYDEYAVRAIKGQCHGLSAQTCGCPGARRSRSRRWLHKHAQRSTLRPNWKFC